ncbi:YciE/YciF ferroxidase family protein [Zunongwangia profunda]|jgi:ferritin-like metal-binding protein YciE|uniref:YciE/YciF ferroxidase family protein n=1 Tax=Zunongwangia profunda TaxID=398743 RepID=UPI000C91AFC9|nr:ferritin-like domain-containing protein [Zunongwangia profunda]MAG88423.1 hypothetical protein [Flavobacteriaceae bacterium]MCC4228158.1 ferritin-like domain-containing protein [Zunongwangia profunda]|tara:strand:+ start:32 stop:517 length:486 start_codon:yes stop_codon:yes gene_type:complete
MKNLKDLFVHQLKDLFSAETQLIGALPEMINQAKTPNLKKIFEIHLKETQEHQIRLKDICEDLGISPSGEVCNAMKGLIAEAKNFLEEEVENEFVRDAGIIADAQRIEHYEIAGYGTLVKYAKELGYTEISEKLNKTLQEEYEADEKLNSLATNQINRKAE